ncbi:MAG TPA: YkvA family protein [Arenimonas sp.]|uniref:YkvA family protein n=1 Tax=Arenimonas sp. TaxID=1872635 RepID=UPI002D7EE7F4|nr:YkvA family protein [Arenimonas sp.]HEU0154020.1 YkvA family protein [Arenimonas sp.]
MPLAISFELSDRDLEHFTQALAKARAAAGSKTADEIIAAASKLLVEANKVEVPDFIAERLDRLDALIAMSRDEGWHLPEEDRQRVLSALVYFADPSDVIPDNVPVLGYFDDAIAIEMCVKELKHEIEAYDEFCEYRQGEAERRGLDPATVGRADWLEARRDELVDRMHRRRNRQAGGSGYGDSSGYARKGYTSAFRPGLMRVR